MDNFVRDGATTYFHQAGTCRMGKDGKAVLDFTVQPPLTGLSLWS
jgi:choline dehydrogenase-like flavoprotein